MSDPVAEPRAVLEEFELGPDDLVELIELVRRDLAAEVAAVRDEHASPAGAIPIVHLDDVAAGSVAPEVRTAVARRGVVVLRGTFERRLAEAWDAEIAEYLERNRFEERFARPDPGRTAPSSRIWGVYWSRPQVLARQHPRMVRARRFLNGFWSHSASGGFDPDHDIGYPDRLRRRAPGVEAGGLPLHVDSTATVGWRSDENRRVFRDVFVGRPEEHDPWDASEHTSLDTPTAGSPAGPSSVFRTFQGWTALSEMRPGDGGLHTIPIPAAVHVSLLEGLAGELGLTGDGPVAASSRARPDAMLAEALIPVPAVEPGDTVWWHGDVFHSVSDATNRDRWSNVMYIGAAPRCAKNDHYAATTYERFAGGRSPVDFPAEDVEVDFAGRAGPDDLDEVGRQQFGLDPLAQL